MNNESRRCSVGNARIPATLTLLATRGETDAVGVLTVLVPFLRRVIVGEAAAGEA